jgi:hypothetical protein
LLAQLRGGRSKRAPQHSTGFFLLSVFGHRLRRGQSLLISSHMDVHSVRSYVRPSVRPSVCPSVRTPPPPCPMLPLLLGETRKRVQGTDSTCPCCGQEDEDLEHALRMCPEFESPRRRNFVQVPLPLSVMTTDQGTSREPAALTISTTMMATKEMAA